MRSSNHHLPPPDETAHLGYAQEIASLQLPEITVEPEVPGSATQWQAERAAAKDDRYRAVLVANHPPLNYMLTAPLIWISSATESPDGGLILLRFANVAFAAVGVVFTYLLALEVCARDRRLALLAAVLVALIPQGHAVFSQGLNDGLGFAAGTAMVWAGARCFRSPGPFSNRDLLVMAAAATVAFGSRAATMLLAIAVVGFVAAYSTVSTHGNSYQRVRSGLRTMVIGLVPAVVALGWFYVRNIRLYGDIGASHYLLETFQRRPRGSVISMVPQGHMWADVYQGLLSPSTIRRSIPPGIALISILAIVGLIIVMITGRTSRTTGSPERGSVSRSGLLLCAAAVGLIAATIAQHASGGGNSYSRYALPIAGVLAVLIVVGLERLWSRWAPTIVVALMGWWALLTIPVDVDAVGFPRPRDGDKPTPLELRVLPLNDGWRVAAAVAIVIGVAAVVTILLAPSHDMSAPIPRAGADRDRRESQLPPAP